MANHRPRRPIERADPDHELQALRDEVRELTIVLRGITGDNGLVSRVRNLEANQGVQRERLQIVYQATLGVDGHGGHKSELEGLKNTNRWVVRAIIGVLITIAGSVLGALILVGLRTPPTP